MPLGFWLLEKLGKICPTSFAVMMIFPAFQFRNFFFDHMAFGSIFFEDLFCDHFSHPHDETTLLPHKRKPHLHNILAPGAASVCSLFSNRWRMGSRVTAPHKFLLAPRPSETLMFPCDKVAWGGRAAAILQAALHQTSLLQDGPLSKKCKCIDLYSTWGLQRSSG